MNPEPIPKAVGLGRDSGPAGGDDHRRAGLAPGANPACLTTRQLPSACGWCHQTSTGDEHRRATGHVARPPCVRLSRTRLTSLVHRMAYAAVGLIVPVRRGRRAGWLHVAGTGCVRCQASWIKRGASVEPLQWSVVVCEAGARGRRGDGRRGCGQSCCAGAARRPLCGAGGEHRRRCDARLQSRQRRKGPTGDRRRLRSRRSERVLRPPQAIPARRAPAEHGAGTAHRAGGVVQPRPVGRVCRRQQRGRDARREADPALGLKVGWLPTVGHGRLRQRHSRRAASGGAPRSAGDADRDARRRAHRCTP